MSEFKKNDLVRLSHRNRSNRAGDAQMLGSVVQVRDVDMGAGRVLVKVQVLWLTGPELGKTSIMDERGIVHAATSEAQKGEKDAGR